MSKEKHKPEARAVEGRKTLIGHVVSSKMKDTIVVTEERLVQHAVYKKYMRRKSKYVAHDPGNTAKVGDDVEIMQTRPISKTKNWRLVRVVRRSHGAVVHADVDVAAEAIGRKDASAVAPEAKS
jgi:small subunit ribosomal protein S17